MTHPPTGPDGSLQLPAALLLFCPAVQQLLPHLRGRGGSALLARYKIVNVGDVGEGGLDMVDFF